VGNIEDTKIVTIAGRSVRRDYKIASSQKARAETVINKPSGVYSQISMFSPAIENKTDKSEKPL
jgi:hypothetical protein